MQKNKKPRFIKPPNILKKKVGHGGFDEKLVVKSQNYLDMIEIDFVPYAENFLREFSAAVAEAARSPDKFHKARDRIIRPVMMLKANGGMFQFGLVTEVADTALQFLEAVDPEVINDETFDVLKAHENTLKAIIANNLKGDGGREGHALVRELDKACKRYFAKYGPQ